MLYIYIGSYGSNYCTFQITFVVDFTGAILPKHITVKIERYITTGRKMKILSLNFIGFRFWAYVKIMLPF